MFKTKFSVKKTSGDIFGWYWSKVAPSKNGARKKRLSPWRSPTPSLGRCLGTWTPVDRGCCAQNKDPPSREGGTFKNQSRIGPSISTEGQDHSNSNRIDERRICPGNAGKAENQKDRVPTGVFERSNKRGAGTRQRDHSCIQNTAESPEIVRWNGSQRFFTLSGMVVPTGLEPVPQLASNSLQVLTANEINELRKRMCA
jgi:hypothetical protein